LCDGGGSIDVTGKEKKGCPKDSIKGHEAILLYTDFVKNSLLRTSGRLFQKWKQS